MHSPAAMLDHSQSSARSNRHTIVSRPHPVAPSVLAVFGVLAAGACGDGGLGSLPPLEPQSSVEKDFAETFTDNADFDQGQLQGVNHDRAGELRLDVDVFELRTPYLWAPLSAINKVVRIDTQTGAQMTIDLTQGSETCHNPSRTTVDLDFGVWMGCRGNAGGDDTNADPDDKVVHVTKDGRVDMVLHSGWAARAVALDAYGHLWVGSSYDGTVWEFDAATGECILGESTPAKTCRHPAICLRDDGACGSVLRSDYNKRHDGGTFPYGAMVDQFGDLWIKGAYNGKAALHRIDVQHPTGTDADHAAHHRKQVITVPDGTCSQLYGLTVDLTGDVWTGGAGCNDVKHFDGDTGELIGAYKAGGDTLTRGVAVDRDGNIWVANSNAKRADGTWEDGSVSQFDPTGRHLQTVFLEQDGKAVKVTTGVGIDAYGNVWAMGSGSNIVMQFNPTHPEERRVIETQGIMYTYSDMLGTGLRTVTTRQRSARWRTTIDSESPNPTWGTIDWLGREPNGTSLAVDVRCADTREELALQTFQRVATSQTDVPCEGHRWLEVQVLFNAVGTNASPSLEELTVTWQAAVEEDI